MKKSIYSLLLSEDVVRAVDEAAHRRGASRSAMVNEILAQYVSIPTPEQQASQIFRAIEALAAASRELVPFVSPNSPVMSMKSSLTYKYRPTVRYEVDLNGGTGGGAALGQFNVVFRTQSRPLIEALGAFFRLWAGIEDTYLAPLLGGSVEYALHEGRFERPIAAPRGRNCTAEEIAEAISGYVQLFDRLLKGQLSGRLTDREVEQAYLADLRQRTLLV